MRRSRSVGSFVVLSALAVLVTNSLGARQFPEVAAPMPAVLRDYPSVTADRLKNPEDGNWLMIRRTYNGWGYSPLEQITPANVRRLRPIWGFSTGESRSHESAPIVNNGVMFVTSPNAQVIAIDARSGNVLWRYRRTRPQSALVPHDTNRGVALYGDKVFYAAGEAALVALDAKTGKEVWVTKVAENKGDNNAVYYITLAPLVADGKILVGTSGADFGIRGFVAAYDPDTGKELWRTHTIPAPGDPGSDTWPKGDHWKKGGASIWVTGNYDPETNLTFWGTGNGSPGIGDQRPGDNLYTSSTLALDATSGAIKGYFQYHPNDSWDWDEVSPPILVDFKRSGRTIKGLIDVARDGYLWFLDRSAGSIRFVEGKPYVYQDVFRGLDPVTGRPDVDPAHKPGTEKEAGFCPDAHGGKTWPPIAFSPKTRMIYVPANNNLCMSMVGVPATDREGRAFAAIQFGRFFMAPGADHFGEVQAWNVDTGHRVWTHAYKQSSNWGSMLATAGGLVFTGGTSDRKFHAFDASTGKLLWEFSTTSGILAPPSSFTVDGKQYVAVVSGWGGDARGMQQRLNILFPGTYPEVPEGGAVWVFGLP
jgi:alcohol dehydrogenase (cytochrome c)